MARPVDPEVFILLLNEAVEADRIAKRVIRGMQNKSRARRFFQLCRSDLKHALSPYEPIDCVQQMGTGR